MTGTTVILDFTTCDVLAVELPDICPEQKEYLKIMGSKELSDYYGNPTFVVVDEQTVKLCHREDLYNGRNNCLEYDICSGNTSKIQTQTENTKLECDVAFYVHDLDENGALEVDEVLNFINDEMFGGK